MTPPPSVNHPLLSPKSLDHLVRYKVTIPILVKALWAQNLANNLEITLALHNAGINGGKQMH